MLFFPAPHEPAPADRGIPRRRHCELCTHAFGTRRGLRTRMQRNHFSLSRLRRGRPCLTPLRPVHPHLSRLAAPCKALSRSTRSCPFLPVSARFCTVLSRSSPTLPHPALTCSAPPPPRPSHALPRLASFTGCCCPARSSPTQSCPSLPRPAWSCLVLLHPARSGPVLP